MKRKILWGITAVALSASCSLSVPPAQAAYTVTLEQEGTSVVATGSGTIDLTDLTDGGIFGLLFPSDLFPSRGVIVTGPGTSKEVYEGLISGPTSFGSGSSTAGSGSGDPVGVDPNFFVWLPVGYVSGGALSSNATWDNQTFSSLGVTPGEYEWTWGSGAHADSFTLDIVTAAVPEPSSVGLVALPLGLGMLLAAQRRRAARNT